MTVSKKVPFLKRFAEPIVEEGLDYANGIPQAAKIETGRGESRFTRVRNETTDDD